MYMYMCVYINFLLFQISFKRQFHIYLLLLVLACLITIILLNCFVTFITKESFLELPDINCHRNPPFLVILVSSELGERKARMIIRKTWGKKRVLADKLILTFFLLGNHFWPYKPFNVTVENLHYKDIIQKNFIDSYNNLTLKTLMGFEWINKFCPQATFVMKIDSDMFVNVYYLIELLQKRKSTTQLYTGSIKINEKPIRNPDIKWYISKEEYPENFYPPFCSGTGYVVSSDVASQVYIVSKQITVLRLEDVFIGMCVAKLKIQPEKLHSEPVFFPEKVIFSPCHYKKIVTSHFITPSQNLIYWNALERHMDEKCSNDQKPLQLVYETYDKSAWKT